MSYKTFHAESIPLDRLQKLSVFGGFSYIYPNSKPSVDVVGNWQKRYCSLGDTFLPVLDRVKNFEVRENDVWVVTSAKCGTTWAQEMTWLIMNSFDYEKAKSVDIGERSPFLEFNGVAPSAPDVIEAANKLTSPRLMKSHLPAWLLPKQLWTKKPKIIYLFRDPKDAAVSYYHHWIGIVSYQGNMADLIQSYIDGLVFYTPFWPHVLDFWQIRNQPQIFFTSYERMKSDLCGVIKDVCKFLEREISKDQLPQLIEHLSFNKMKNNPACNHIKEHEIIREATNHALPDFSFIRRGIVGSYKDELPQSSVQQLDNWIENSLKDYQLTVDDFINYTKY
ncbi:luciferin sulfotransferase-like [Eurosta solidaginis]|uniref:luciferin sulfotransferase-like n=1 Tax=Eurosta solidaginis TaxID=178769 RepID=UPI0035306502